MAAHTCRHPSGREQLQRATATTADECNGCNCCSGWRIVPRQSSHESHEQHQHQQPPLYWSAGVQTRKQTGLPAAGYCSVWLRRHLQSDNYNLPHAACCMRDLLSSWSGVGPNGRLAVPSTSLLRPRHTPMLGPPCTQLAAACVKTYTRHCHVQGATCGCRAQGFFGTTPPAESEAACIMQ